MALKIDQGLFSKDFTDHHAILGVSVEASPKDIRKRYLKIARRLHPDSSALKTEAEKQLAHELLSKLVNPAYEKLTQEKEQREYKLLLQLKGKDASQQQDTIVLTSQVAGKLAGSVNYTSDYTSALQDLSGQQYESLDNALNIIGQISELNLVYLMKQAQAEGPPSPPKPLPIPSPSPSPPKGGPGKPPPPPDPGEILRGYWKRAEEYESKGNFPKAVQELRDAIKYEPKNGESHSRLGAVYMRSKQAKMAKIHFGQALKLNPNDELAKAGLRRLDPNSKGTPSGKPPSDKKGKSKDASKSSGGIFGLFGGKKK